MVYAPPLVDVIKFLLKDYARVWTAASAWVHSTKLRSLIRLLKRGNYGKFTHCNQWGTPLQHWTYTGCWWWWWINDHSLQLFYQLFFNQDIIQLPNISFSLSGVKSVEAVLYKKFPAFYLIMFVRSFILSFIMFCPE